MSKTLPKIAIIGAGFTGLSSGLRLSQLGYRVTIFEFSDQPGGLALGFKDPSWGWTLEHHYHHLFVTDQAISDLAKGVGYTINYSRPKTSTYSKSKISQIDSAISLLRFKDISMLSRFRTGLVLFCLKISPIWQPLEKITVKKFILTAMGKESWRVLWQPLMDKKFGRFSGNIPASWFWARIKSRTASLGYPEGGFLLFAQAIAKKILKNQGKIFYSTRIVNIEKSGDQIKITSQDNRQWFFDQVICTLPTDLFLNITPSLPDQYKKTIKKLQGIGAANLVLSLKNQFLEDGTYWLNINDHKFPFLAVVEHTNFVDSKNYNNERIIYVGSYIDTKSKYFKLSDQELLKIYLPYLKKINPMFERDWINKFWLYRANFAQPIISKRYSKQIPAIRTPIKGLYLANIQQVYPWDRGTNYAVALGQKVAQIIYDQNS